MSPSAHSNTNARPDRGTSPPAAYAGLFIGVTGLIGFLTMIAAVTFA